LHYPVSRLNLKNYDDLTVRCGKGKGKGKGIQSSKGKGNSVYSPPVSPDLSVGMNYNRNADNSSSTKATYTSVGAFVFSALYALFA
jgi:hypothetical protein